MSLSEEQKVNRESKVGLRLGDVILNREVNSPAIAELKKSMGSEDRIINVSDRLIILRYITQQVLAMELEDVLEEAKAIVKPYHPKGVPKKTLIISSASSSSGSQEFEKGRLDKGESIVDIPGAIEGRDTRSGKQGDIALVSTESGLIMAKAQNVVDTINLAEEVVAELSSGEKLKAQDLYYKADALLMLLLTNPMSPIVLRLIDELAQEPLVYPYNLDEETQVALVILAKMGKINRIDVNANSSEVGVQLTRKGYRYPTLEEAARLTSLENPYEMQSEEWKLSQAAHEIDHHPDFVPGYVIKKTSAYPEFKKQVLESLKLMKDRYGFTEVWTKPDRGTDGGNQEAISTDLADEDLIEERIDAMWKSDGDWVIEAKTNFFKIILDINGSQREFATSTSVHIIKGELRTTVTLQLVDGTQWGGNLICSKETWDTLIDSIDKDDSRIKNNPDLINQLKNSFELMIASMSDYMNAVNNSEKYNGGQVRGGIDLAIATLGGKFGDEIFVVVQDNNARANGSEVAYALYDSAKKEYGQNGEAITRNISPLVDFNEFSSQLPDVVSKVNQDYDKLIDIEQVRLVAVSAGWGQIGMVGTDVMEIFQDVFLVEQELRNRKLIR